jgi:hypothetical protein
MKAENNIIAIIVAIRNFLEGLNDIHHAMRTETVPRYFGKVNFTNSIQLRT